MGHHYRTFYNVLPQDWRNRHLESKENNLAHNSSQEKWVVSPQETESDLPMSVEESPVEAWAWRPVNAEDFGHLIWRADSFEKTLMLGKIARESRRGRQRMRWLDGNTDSMDMSLSNSGTWWWTGRHGMLLAMGLQSLTWLSDWTDWQCWGRLFWTVLWRPTTTSRTNTQKRCPFHYKGLECKSRKSRNNFCQTGKFGVGVQNEVGQRLIEFCQENALFIANTLFQQHKKRLYTWTSPDGQHQNQTCHILCSERWRSSIQSAKPRPGAEYDSDHKLLMAKFRLKLKKVGKATRSLRYDLNQIPYNYTMEVRNRFKGLNLTEGLMNYAWMFLTLYRRQGSRPSPRIEMQKSKMDVWGGLTNSCEKKGNEKQRSKGKIYPFECRVPMNSKER